MHSAWFFLGRDFAIRTISIEIVIGSVFFLFSKASKFKLCNQTYEKKTCKCPHLCKTIPKTLSFYRTYNKNEEDEYSRSEFYYPEDLETSNIKNESGIGESREAIDDFIKKPKSPNTNKKMVTDLNTLLY